MKAYNKEYNKLLSHISSQFNSLCVCVVCKEEGKEKNGKNDNINSCIDSLSLLSTYHVLLYNNTARVYTYIIQY